MQSSPFVQWKYIEYESSGAPSQNTSPLSFSYVIFAYFRMKQK